MKKLYSIIATLTIAMLTLPAFAQMDCNDGRFYNRTYFADWDSTENILFGSGPAVGNGQTQELKMCVFQPVGDQLTKRPVIVFTFGGSFVTGQRQDIYGLCIDFVKMGYVAVATDYRVGFFFPSEVTTTQAVVRGMHDMKAAVRYLYKDAQTDNLFNIDTNYIIVGGVSAGAICAIQTAYLRDNSEIPDYLLNDTAGMGGVEGLSGNPGYSSRVAGVIDFSGTTGDTLWINAGEAPIVGLHDVGDQTVPYGTGPINVGGFPTGLTASGTRDIMARTNTLGIPNAVKIYPGTGHVAYLQGSQEMYDEAIDFAQLFVADLVCGNAALSVNESQLQESISFYPNPANGTFTMTFANSKNETFMGTISDVTGRAVRTFSTNTTKVNLDCTNLSSGLYSVSLTNGAQNITGKVVLQ